MDPIASLFGLAAIHLLAAVTPGPNTIVVSQQSLARSRRAGLAAAMGVSMGSTVWVVLTLAGVGVLLAEAGWLYNALRLAGAAYLIHVGLRLMLAAWRGARDDALRPAPASIGRSPFRLGLATNLTNPKSAAFWTSLFVVAVPPAAPWWFFAAVVAIVAAQSSAWYAVVALTFSTGAMRGLYRRAGRWLDALVGAVMVALGLRLALASR